MCRSRSTEYCFAQLLALSKVPARTMVDPFPGVVGIFILTVSLRMDYSSCTEYSVVYLSTERTDKLNS